MTLLTILTELAAISEKFDSVEVPERYEHRVTKLKKNIDFLAIAIRRDKKRENIIAIINKVIDKQAEKGYTGWHDINGTFNWKKELAEPLADTLDYTGDEALLQDALDWYISRDVGLVNLWYVKGHDIADIAKFMTEYIQEYIKGKQQKYRVEKGE